MPNPSIPPPRRPPIATKAPEMPREASAAGDAPPEDFILTDAQAALLKARATEPDLAGQSSASIAAALSAPVPIPNPDPQPQVPAPLPWRAIMGAIAPSTRWKVMNLSIADRVIDAINSGDVEVITNYVEMMAAADPPILTPQDVQGMQALMGRTRPDPDWPPTIEGPSWAAQNWPGVEFFIPAAGEPSAPADYVPAFSVIDHITYQMVDEALAR